MSLSLTILAATAVAVLLSSGWLIYYDVIHYIKEARRMDRDQMGGMMKVGSDNFVMSTDDLGTVIITDLSDKNHPDKFFIDPDLLDELHHLLGVFLQERGE